LDLIGATPGTDDEAPAREGVRATAQWGDDKHLEEVNGTTGDKGMAALKGQFRIGTVLSERKQLMSHLLPHWEVEF
jgi:hypothetical protein